MESFFFCINERGEFLRSETQGGKGTLSPKNAEPFSSAIWSSVGFYIATMEDWSPISDLLSPASAALVQEVVESEGLDMPLDFGEVTLASDIEEEEIREVESDVLLAVTGAVQQAPILEHCQILSQLVNGVCEQQCVLGLVIAVMRCLCGLLPHVGDMHEGFFKLHSFLGDRLGPLIVRHGTEGCVLMPIQEFQAHPSPPGQTLPCPCGILFRMEVVFWGACWFVPDGDVFTYDFRYSSHV